MNTETNKPKDFYACYMYPPFPNGILVDSSEWSPEEKKRRLSELEAKGLIRRERNPIKLFFKRLELPFRQKLNRRYGGNWTDDNMSSLHRFIWLLSGGHVRQALGMLVFPLLFMVTITVTITYFAMIFITLLSK